jgi:CO/xanthine dehydrogenase FAD-binding subunit
MGKRVEPEVIERASRLIEREVRPITDLRSEEEYRRRMVYVMLKRGLTKVMKEVHP